MPLSDYVKIEAAIPKKILVEWQPKYNKIYNQMLGFIKQSDFDAAYNLIKQLNLKSTIESQRKQIEFGLKAASLYGAKNTTKLKSTLFNNKSVKSKFDLFVDNFINTISDNASLRLQLAANRMVSKSKNTYNKIKKEERFVEEFVSFENEADNMVKLVSSLHTSRMSTWGFTAEADALGLVEYKVTAVLDGRTSDFCSKVINGRVFDVSDAADFVEQVLAITDPDVLKEIQAWPDQDVESIKAYQEMSNEELVALGLHIPPYHPFCRSMCVPVDKKPRPIIKPISEGLIAHIEQGIKNKQLKESLQ